MQWVLHRNYLIIYLNDDEDNITKMCLDTDKNNGIYNYLDKDNYPYKWFFNCMENKTNCNNDKVDGLKFSLMQIKNYRMCIYPDKKKKKTLLFCIYKIDFSVVTISSKRKANSCHKLFTI